MKRTNRPKKDTNDRKKIQTQLKSEKSKEPDGFAERVEKKAYELYEKRGGGHGCHIEDWYEALRIVEEEMIPNKELGI